jgi:hypothetical protein
MQQMMMSMLIQFLVGNFGWLAMLAAIAVFSWKLVKGARKPVLAALLVLAFAAWWFWPSSQPSRVIGDPRQEAPGMATVPAGSRPAFKRSPGPVAAAGDWSTRPGATYAQRHAPAIQRLAEQREEKVRHDPSYLDPKARAERLAGWLVKERERQRKEELAAKEQRRLIDARRVVAAPPAIITPDQARELRLQMIERRNVQAQMTLQQSQQQMRQRWGIGQLSDDTKTDPLGPELNPTPGLPA